MRNAGEEPARYLVFEFQPHAIGISKTPLDRIPGVMQLQAAAHGIRRLKERLLPRRKLAKARQRLAKRVRRIADFSLLKKRVTRFARAAAPQGGFGKMARRLRKRTVHVARKAVSARYLVRETGRQIMRPIGVVRRALTRDAIVVRVMPLARHTVRFIPYLPLRERIRERARHERQRREMQKTRRRLKTERRRRKRADGKKWKRVRNSLRNARRLRATGNLADALAACDNLPTPHREHIKVVVQRAYILGQLGQWDAAHDVLRMVLSSQRANDKAWMQMASVLIRLGRVDDLPALVDEMLAARSYTAGSLLLAASIARKGRYFTLADTLIDKALSP
jgi:hypothetical protein